MCFTAGRNFNGFSLTKRENESSPVVKDISYRRFLLLFGHMKSDAEVEVCAVCKIPAKQKCSGCKSVYYCGRDHQKAHWNEHFQKCKCYKLIENEKLGRHYIATRCIESGEVVIREDEALVRAPQQVTMPVCLECNTPLAAQTAVACDECGWPLCGTCKKHGAECDFTKRYRDSKVSITGFGLTHPTYKCIGIIRALSLRDVNPDAYKRFLTLSSHCDDVEDTESRKLISFVKRFFVKLTDVSEEEISRIVGILLINSHEVPTTEPAHIAVYDASSYLEHSCKANCSKSFTNNGGIVIRAATKIEKGDHITICYTDPLWGTANRRHHLLRTKFFECTCERCSDPTEFNTMFNAIKCSKSDCNGYMLPKTFISTEIPDYKCAKCDNAVNSNLADSLLEEIGKNLASMKKQDVGAIRNFIGKYSLKLHENHFYMTDVKLALVQLLGQQGGGLPALDNEVLSEKIILCKKLNDLLKTIVPAENRIRGLILIEMYSAVAEFGRRQDKEQLYNVFQEAKKLLEEAYQLLKHEPDILPEGKIAKIARKNLQDIELIMKKLCQNAVTPL